MRFIKYEPPGLLAKVLTGVISFFDFPVFFNNGDFVDAVVVKHWSNR